MLAEQIIYLSSVTYLGNTLLSYSIAIGVFLLLLLIMRWFKTRCLKALDQYSESTRTTLDDFVIDSLQGLPKLFFFIIALYASVQFLSLPEIIDSVVYVLFVILAVSQVGITLGRVILHILSKTYLNDIEGKHTISLLRMIINIVIASIALLMILSNLGVAVTPLVTSFGVVGIAVGFALTNIIEDLFSSVSIYIDKPFRIGDYIEINELSGKVLSVGIKTTRILTTRGEELVIANRNLTNQTVRNYGKMDHRTTKQKFLLPYETDQKKLQQIPSLMEEIIATTPGTNLERIHLTNLTKSGVEFTYRYTIKSNEYVDFLDAQQAINLKLLKELASLGMKGVVV